MPENTKNVAVEKLNEALDKAAADVVSALPVDPECKTVIKNRIADAFCPVFVELGLISGVQEDVLS